MKKILKKTINRFRYPYICTHQNLTVGRNIRFHINNPVEKFRLENFGDEKDQLLALLSILKEGDIFYDIGASVGAWSIPAAIKVGTSQVISFEPDPENQERLVRNFELNGISNFQIMPIAVGDKTGEMELFTAGAYAASPSLRPVNNISSSIVVKIKTIDSLISQNEIPVPTVVKIDIEGAEMMALKGMSMLLSHDNRPNTLVLELHPVFLPSFNTDLTEIFEFLISKGYKIGELFSREKQIICHWYA